MFPPFGSTVISPDLPFGGTFDNGQYQVRAFNNEAGTIDTDQKLTFHALGKVRGEEKLLELADVQSITSMRLINCQNPDPSAPCPDLPNPPDPDHIDAIPGREPASTPVLPTWDQAYYRDADNLPCAGDSVQINGDVKFVDDPTNKAGEMQLQSGKCYYVTGDAVVNKVTARDHVVIFSNKSLTVEGVKNNDPSKSTIFTDSIMIGLEEVQLKQHANIQSPGNFPALITGGVTKGDQGVQVKGNIFAQGSVGTEHDRLNWDKIEGSIIAGDVYLKNPLVTDNNDDNYYNFMPGFDYPDEFQTMKIGQDKWKELQ